METEGLDFAAALEALAERSGVELEREAEDPREAERRGRRERLLALLERTAAFYVRVLWESDEAAPARAYLAERGLQEDVLREFRVGFSPRAWDRVIDASQRNGFSETELLAAGPRLAPPRRLRAARPLPRPDHVPARRPQGPRARVRRPCAARRRPAEVPQHVGVRALPQGQPRLRRRPRPRRRGALRPARAGRGLHGRDRAAPGRDPRVGLLDGHRADRAPARRAQAADARRCCSARTRTPPARRRSRRARTRSAPSTRRTRCAASSCASCGCPPGRDPADVVQQDGAEAMRSLLETLGAGRALRGRARDRARRPRPAPRAATTCCAPWRRWSSGSSPGALQYDLIQLIVEPAADPGGRDRGGAAPRAARAAAQRRRGRPRRRAPGHLGRPARGDRARVPGPLPRGQGAPAARRSRRWTSTRRSRSS